MIFSHKPTFSCPRRGFVSTAHYVWLVTMGEFVLQQQLTGDVDRLSRRDLSIFRLGWDWLERRFALRQPFPIRFFPNFCLVYGR